ncbi:MAG: anthranilate/aminodeoxychorismate synthase component II [Alphaproteobacteria bacterium CG_4_10_14_0_2_um_filter_63_37]|nr:MAG: anthranilate/aminodeoxychorismate synthase component II [Proteobacteria bacterium CG1_02_64_396]PJA24137.1 MAG: anthranilate/aminodeoxychorismate synthase component II [Alphaproteobacteria bacterium CG_4_10_14_0_2_um_filter_63_37]
MNASTSQQPGRRHEGPTRRVLMIDNYDSFTFNVVQYLGELGAQVEVARNDAITVAEIETFHPDHIVISPGPCTPSEAGISLEVIRHFAGRIPLLGICLGHQAMGQAFGGNVVRAPAPVHGKTGDILHDARGVFSGMPSPFAATRYHSLVVDRATLPDCLEISAWLEDGLIMGLRHRTLPAVEGVQFHPESIMTQGGHTLLRNFLNMSIAHPAQPGGKP